MTRTLGMILAAVWATAGCDFSSTEELPDAGTRSDEPPDVASSLELGRRGGLVAVADSDVTLFGASLDVPPGALGGRQQITLQPAGTPDEMTGEASEPIPEGSNVMGVGAVLEMRPDGLELGSFARVRMPIPDGVPIDGVTAARWDEGAGQWLPVADAVAQWGDPRDEVGGELVFDTRRLGRFRAIYEDQEPVSVLNDGSSALTIEPGSARFLTQGSRGYTPRPFEEGELSITLAPGESREIQVVPGEYVFFGTFEGESVPRCSKLSVTEPVGEGEGLVFADDTPPCSLPAARLTASQRTVETGAVSSLTATATASGDGMLDWAWSATGGVLEGTTSGQVAPGDEVTIDWRAPATAGTYHVYFTASDPSGFLATSRARITVAGPNQRPRVAEIRATPVSIGAGFPEGARGNVDRRSPGTTLLDVRAQDNDGDPVNYYWTHVLPGSFHDEESGVRLGRDEETGLVVWPETGEPYRKKRILFHAPPSEVLEEHRSGIWDGMLVLASDGSGWDRGWLMVNEVLEGTPEPDAGMGQDGGRPPPPRDAGFDAGTPPTGVVGRCQNTAIGECELYSGSFYAGPNTAPLMTACADEGGTWADAIACPEAGATGACVRFAGENREVWTVYYIAGALPEDVEMLQMECESIPVAEGGPGDWRRPYRAP